MTSMTGGGFFNVLWERAISIKTIGMMIWLYDDMVAWFFFVWSTFSICTTDIR